MLSHFSSKAANDLRAFATSPAFSAGETSRRCARTIRRPSDIVVERIEGWRLFDHADGLIELREERLRVGQDGGRVRTRGVQRLRNVGLKVELQFVVELLAAGIDVNLDAIPAGIIGVECRFGAGDISFFEGGDRVHEGRADRLDTRDLEALSPGPGRLRLTGGSHVRSDRDDADAKNRREFHHGATPLLRLPCTAIGRTRIRYTPSLAVGDSR